MDASETVTAEADATTEPRHPPQDWPEREAIGLSALFEIQQLTKVVRKVLANDADEESACILARGMLRRVEELADTVYSLISTGYDDRTLAELGAIVRAEPQLDVNLGEVPRG